MTDLGKLSLALASANHNLYIEIDCLRDGDLMAHGEIHRKAAEVIEVCKQLQAMAETELVKLAAQTTEG